MAEDSPNVAAARVYLAKELRKAARRVPEMGLVELQAWIFDLEARNGQ